MAAGPCTGSVPGPEHDPTIAVGLCPADRSTYVIQTSHHTGVVAGVLAAALLRSGRTTAPAPTGRARHPAAVATTARTPSRSPSSGPPTARGPMPCERLPLAERMPCTPLVLGAELRTAAARRDPARVRDLVAWACEHDWAHLPSVRQGAALLSRVARATAQPASLAS